MTADVVLVTTNPTISMKEAAANQKWLSKFTGVMGRLSASLKAFDAAAKGQDFVAMQDSCGRIGVAARDMGAHAARSITGRHRRSPGAVDNFHLAGSKCGTLTPEAGRDAVQAVLTDLQNGMAAMQEASNAINSAAE